MAFVEMGTKFVGVGDKSLSVVDFFRGFYGNGSLVWQNQGPEWSF